MLNATGILASSVNFFVISQNCFILVASNAFLEKNVETSGRLAETARTGPRGGSCSGALFQKVVSVYHESNMVHYLSALPTLRKRHSLTC